MGLEDFKIKIFADGANLDDMLAVYHKGLVGRLYNEVEQLIKK